MSCKAKSLFCAALAAAAFGARAEAPDEFAQRVNKLGGGVAAVVNIRDDKSLGSIAIALPEKLVGDRPALDPVLAEVGKFAAAEKMRATVVAPTQADADHMIQAIKAAGVAQVTSRVMAEMVGNKTSRVFLSPAAGQK